MNNRHTLKVTIEMDYGFAEGKFVAVHGTRQWIEGEGLHLRSEDGSPNKVGISMSTIAMVSGLAANIHFAHERKIWDSAEHLRHIIEELELQFVKIPEISILKGKGGQQ